MWDSRAKLRLIVAVSISRHPRTPGQKKDRPAVKRPVIESAG